MSPTEFDWHLRAQDPQAVGAGGQERVMQALRAQAGKPWTAIRALLELLWNRTRCLEPASLRRFILPVHTELVSCAKESVHTELRTSLEQLVVQWSIGIQWHTTTEALLLLELVRRHHSPVLLAHQLIAARLAVPQLACHLPVPKNGRSIGGCSRRWRPKAVEARRRVVDSVRDGDARQPGSLCRTHHWNGPWWVDRPLFAWMGSTLQKGPPTAF